VNRNAIHTLLQWKVRKDRKPLVLRGARQVGKTWLMKEFGKSHYSNSVYFNFDEDDALTSIFETNKNPHRIVELLSIVAGERIEPHTTLLIFDEIQECPAALNALKYFKEKANDYHVIAAGSLLGTLLAAPKSYPVGMVNLLDIQPLTFDEFLAAINPTLYSYYESIQKDQHIEDIFHQRLLDAYNNYLIIGGMPECVASWERYKDPARISEIQRELITIYENDFSKHNGNVNSGRILLVFRSIVAQLAKSNEKFMYGAVRSGGRAARLIGRAWAVVAWSAFAQFFGGLVELKDWVKDLSVLGHHLDVVGSPDWKPLTVQALVGLIGIMVGLVAYTRRDLPS